LKQREQILRFAAELALSRKKPLERREQILRCAQDDKKKTRRDDREGAKG